ncbi:MAG: N-acetylmuramoyl-L-alanine amidase [Candidatus Omnitrophica bacterium]|nr:N-acetylmuramoyl-L-alanine amidase [Candidatus Omnitrophota bacterium]
MKKLALLGLVILLPVILSSCATITPEVPGYPVKEIYPQSSLPVLRQDVFHIVGPGETIWHISKIYDVRMEDVMRVNNLTKARELKMGQRLVIPKAAPIRPVIPLYRSNKWRYIIIHHSATEEGNALRFYKFHRSRGWANLGYHFVIDNGTEGKEDGQIEISPRWIKQQDGAHCQADGMNYKGIGICLVGNFNEEKVSQKQLDSLVYLVNILRDYYKIPLKNIIGHGQVRGAKTECPGGYFPWKEFKKRLD